VKKRRGNPGRRPLPEPVKALTPFDAGLLNGHGPEDGMALVDAILAAGAREWIGETDALAMLRLVKDAWDERSRLREIIATEGHTFERDDRIWPRPEVAMLRELEKILTTWLGLLGLDPVDRGRLGLALVKAKATGLAALREERALKAGRLAG